MWGPDPALISHTLDAKKPPPPLAVAPPAGARNGYQAARHEATGSSTEFPRLLGSARQGPPKCRDQGSHPDSPSLRPRDGPAWIHQNWIYAYFREAILIHRWWRNRLEKHFPFTKILCFYILVANMRWHEVEILLQIKSVAKLPPASAAAVLESQRSLFCQRKPEVNLWICMQVSNSEAVCWYHAIKQRI